MNLLDHYSSWSDRVSDYLNPILIKEARQALKSKQFAICFMGLLLLSWAISALGVVIAGPAIEHGSPGRIFTMFYSWLLVVAVLLVVPFTAYRSMQVEREQTTSELLNISMLTPRNIVLGKLSSSILQIFLYYSAIAPFIAFTSLLQGFDLPNTLFVLVWLLVAAIFTSMACIMLSALTDSRQWAIMNMLGMLIVLMLETFIGCAFTSAFLQRPLSFDDVGFWIGCAIALTGLGGAGYLFQKIAESRLTFEADNRTSSIRVASLILIASQWIICIAIYLISKRYSYHFDADYPITLMFMSGVFLLFFGLWACTEDNHLSRRVRRQIPRSRFLRFIAAFLLPGGTRGLAFFVLLSIFTFCAAFYASPTTGRLERNLSLLYATICYLIFYCSIGAVIGRGLQKLSPLVRPAHCRFIIFLLPIFAAIACNVPSLVSLEHWHRSYSLLDTPNPFSTLAYIGDNYSSHVVFEICFVLTAAAVISIIVNLPAIVRAFGEVIKHEPEQMLRTVSIIDTHPIAPLQADTVFEADSQ